MSRHNIRLAKQHKDSIHEQQRYPRRPRPGQLLSHPGSLARLQDFYSEEQLSRAVWVYGERAIAGAQAFLPAAFNAPAPKILFKGHCSESDVSELARASGDDRSVVIGVGGGALLDTAKALARRLGLPVVAIPTIAATCAAWTPLSVWYNDAGQALQFEIFDDANFLVLVEPHIILNAPAEYLLAGIGDTLAKWYEAVVLAPQPETLPLTVRLGINGALAIRDVLLESSETALADQQRGELTGVSATWWMRLSPAAVWSAGWASAIPASPPPTRCTTG
jgi:uncharacterized oxidoreductase